MALSDCVECWSTPCECGHDFKNASREYKERMINGHTIREVFQWLGKMDYLSDWNEEILYGEFINRNDSKQPKSRGCCSECGEGYDNEEEWLYNTDCELCGHPIPEHLIVKRP